MFQKLSLIALATLVALAVAPGAARQAAAQPPGPVITPIAGGLYQIRSGSQVTVFLAAPAGIMLVDPLGADTAMWLKGEFARRFPNVPVRYVVYASHDFDRGSGGSVFDETAEIIAHENFQLAQRRPVLARAFSADVYGAADFSYHPTGTYCSEGPFWLFEPPVRGGMGGPSGGGTVGVSFSVGRGGIAVELSTGRRLARDWRPTDYRYALNSQVRVRRRPARRAGTFYLEIVRTGLGRGRGYRSPAGEPREHRVTTSRNT